SSSGVAWWAWSPVYRERAGGTRRHTPSRANIFHRRDDVTTGRTDDAAFPTDTTRAGGCTRLALLALVPARVGGEPGVCRAGRAAPGPWAPGPGPRAARGGGTGGPGGRGGGGSAPCRNRSRGGASSGWRGRRRRPPTVTCSRPTGTPPSRR